MTGSYSCYTDHKQQMHSIAMIVEVLTIPGLLLGLLPANERRRYKVTPSLIGWAQTLNQLSNTMGLVILSNVQVSRTISSCKISHGAALVQLNTQYHLGFLLFYFCRLSFNQIDFMGCKVSLVLFYWCVYFNLVFPASNQTFLTYSPYNLTGCACVSPTNAFHV